MTTDRQRERYLHKVPPGGFKPVPLHENSANSPWSYTNYIGMRMAMMITWMRPEWFTVPERLVLVTLYSALVKDSDIVDKRVTQKALAARCGVSVRTVVQAYRKFQSYGLIERLDGGTGRQASLLQVPVKELDEKIHITLGHIDWPF